MIALRIRQAETALKGQRLDEAYDLVRTEDVRTHRRGQRLIDQLAPALVRRGREHFDAGRLQEAMVDCQKAADLAGNTPDVAGLRDDVVQALSRRHRADRQRIDTVTLAKEHAAHGRLSACQQILEGSDLTQGADKGLMNQAQARRQTAESALRGVRSAMQAGDWATAMDRMVEAKRAHAGSDAVSTLAIEVTTQANERIRTALQQGRLDLADLLLRKLSDLAEGNLDTKEMRRVLGQCHLAGEYVEQGQPRRALEVFRKLTAVLPDASWVGQAMDQARQAADGLEALRGGPIGLLGGSDVAPPKTIARPEPERPSPVQRRSPAAERPSGGRLPTRFMIHVDGVGGFLVLIDRTVRVGPVGSPSHPDVGLLADQHVPGATIERVDEDYFLTGEDDVAINGRPGRRRLLADGDKIALSQRCRFRFRLPHPASTSAVLDLTGARLPKGGARRVILLDREIVIGPGPGTHIRADDLTEPVVLGLRDGVLMGNAKTEIHVADRTYDRHASLPMETQVRIGPVSLVMTPM